MPATSQPLTEADVPQLRSGIYPGRTSFYGRFTTSLIFIAEDGGDGVEYRLTRDEVILLARWLLKQTVTADSPTAGLA